MPGAVDVRGLRDVQLAFSRISTELRVAMQAELRAVAEPVKYRAEYLAVAQIRNIGLAWSSMRIGVTPGVIYIAPAMRRKRGPRRPNLAGELLEAMNQALDDETAEVIAGFELMLDGIVADF